MEEMFERDDKYLWREMELDKGQEQREREMEVIMLWDMRGREEEGDKCMGESCGLRHVIKQVIEKIEREG